MSTYIIAHGTWQRLKSFRAIHIKEGYSRQDVLFEVLMFVVHCFSFLRPQCDEIRISSLID